MNLFAFEFKLDPADAFFRYFNKIAFFIAAVWDDNQVVFAEEILLKQVGYTMSAADFLISNHAEADLIFWNNPLFFQRHSRIER